MNKLTYQKKRAPHVDGTIKTRTDYYNVEHFLHPQLLYLHDALEQLETLKAVGQTEP